jgi:3-oxosteroid 1-dehydrogenase
MKANQMQAAHSCDVSGAARRGACEPIDALYACGNTAAPTFLGVGYQGGSSIGAGMVFGYLAAEHAARRARTTNV